MSAESLSTKAYRYLLEQITDGGLKAGTVLSEATVAASLGISRTPVGEAVRHLVNDGLLEQVPRYGTLVRALGRVELIEHYELREALESYAAGQAARRATVEDVERIRRIANALAHVVEEIHDERAKPELLKEQLRRLLSADMAFHLAVVQAAGNQRIDDVLHRSRSILRIFSMRRHRHDREAARMVHEHHAAIAEAIAAGDAERASALMLEHIRLSKKQALEAFDHEAARGSDKLRELPADVQADLTAIEQGAARRVGRGSRR